MRRLARRENPNVRACSQRSYDSDSPDPSCWWALSIARGWAFSSRLPAKRGACYRSAVSLREGGDGRQTMSGKTPAERYEQGIRLRRNTAREKHADLLGPANRDAVGILAAGDRTRVPELVPVRYQRMLTS